MTRWPAVTLAAVIALALFACVGCESPPDASAESGTTCAHMSERNDAQCAGNLEDCPHDCLHGKDKTQLAAHEGEGCPKSDCTCVHKDKESCAKAHAAAAGEGGHGCAKSECPCPHKGEEGCAKAHAEAGEGDAHAGCRHAHGTDSDSQ
jgi:hypothetical protein